MALNLNANVLKQAAAKLQAEQAQQAQAKASAKKSTAKAKRVVNEPKSEPKGTPKVSGGAYYFIPDEFKKTIEDNLKKRSDMTEKLKRTDKSIEKCCEYIYETMRRKAMEMQKGSGEVGVYSPDEDVFNLAVHYYDESNEDLEKEKETIAMY